MKYEDIIRMAVEADPGFDGGQNAMELLSNSIVGIAAIERFANLVAAHEREACVAIVLDNGDAEGICCTDDVLEALRQRGEKNGG
jgi:hypothetical protein